MTTIIVNETNNTIEIKDVGVQGIAGVSDFTDLSDVPASYAGQSLKVVRVNVGETGLEFAAGGGGVSDHGALTGLSDDDHSQYHNDTRGDARYYTQSQLNAGQLDTRYFTETESNTNFEPKNTNIQSHIASTANPHSVTKSQVGLGNVVNADTTTTANITDSTNKRFVTDADLVDIGNLSGVNTGDQDLSGKANVSHTHALSDLTQSGATSGQVAKWNGSAWAPANESGGGISSINSQTGSTQTIATGTLGTDFAVSSSGDTHTLNLPTASATNTGKLSSTDWSTFNGKQDAIGYTAENVANKENSTLDTSSTKYPTNNLVKTNVDLKANKAGDTFTGAVIPSVVTLTDAATISVNASLGNQFTVTLGGNRTLGNPTSAVNGQLLLFAIRQDGTGSRTITLDTKYRLGTDITGITLTTTINKTDYIGVRYHSGDDKFDVISFSKGY